jgi:DNA-binding MarR family transcriptional regulator
MYRLSTSLPYLLTRLGVRMGDLFTQAARREGMTLQAYRVLAALSEQGRPLRLGELAALVSAETSTLSRLVASMHRAGWLRRERPEHDQRSLHVTLTARGAELAARFMPLAVHYEDVAIGNLTPEQIALLKTTLVTLYDNLDRLAAEVTSGTVERMLAPPSVQPRRAKPK